MHYCKNKEKFLKNIHSYPLHSYYREISLTPLTGPRARRSGGGGLGLELRTNQPSQDLRPHGQKFLQKQIGGKKRKQKQDAKR